MGKQPKPVPLPPVIWQSPAPRKGDVVLYHTQDGPRAVSVPAIVVHAEKPDDPRSRLCLNAFGLHGPMARLFVERGEPGMHNVWSPRE